MTDIFPAIGENDVGSFFRHFSSSLAHCHADIRFLECRRVVHPVASNGDDCATSLQRFYDPVLVFGRDTSEDVGVSHDRGRIGAGELTRMFDAWLTVGPVKLGGD